MSRGRVIVFYGALVAVSVTFWAAPTAVDDAFISYKYAAALVRGDGLVFNVEDGPLEGFTNLAWVVLVAGAIAVKLDPHAFAQCLGLFALVTCIALLWREERPVARGVRAFAVLAVIAATVRMPSYVALAGSGLETSFAALLAVLAGVLLLRGPPSPVAVLTVGTLLVTTRPDGALFLGAWVVAGALPLGQRSSWRRALMLFACAAVPVIALTAFRWAYFHDVVPNTFHAKAADVAQWQAGQAYWVAFAQNSPHVIIALGLWVLSMGVRRELTRLDVYGLVSIALYALYVLRVGGDFMFYRFGFQVVPLVFLLSVESVVAVWRRTPGWVGAPWLAVVVASSWWGSGQPPVEEKKWGMQSVDLMNRFVGPGREAGLALKRTLPRSARISTTLAGTVPYFSELFTVDEWGLNDRHVARLPSVTMREGSRGHQKRVPPEYLDARAVNFELGHPAICDCATPCDEAFPQVYLKLDEHRCLRMRYRARTPELTRLICTSSSFVLNHFDCEPSEPAFAWQHDAPLAVPPVEPGPLTTQAVPDALLLQFRRGVAFGSRPERGALVGQTPVRGHVATLLDSFHGGDETTGWIEVPLAAEVRRVKLRIGGGNDCARVFAGIVSEGRVLSRVCGEQTEVLHAAALEVPAGAASPRLVLVDLSTRPWGHLLVSGVEFEVAGAVSYPAAP